MDAGLEEAIERLRAFVEQPKGSYSIDRDGRKAIFVPMDLIRAVLAVPEVT